MTLELELYGDVAIAGDWHGDRAWMKYATRWAVEQHQMDYIVHVGDIGFFKMSDLTWMQPLLEELGIMLFWIDGNHENHELIATLPRDEYGFGIVSDSIRHIPRGHTFKVNELTWMGFGGASSIDQDRRMEGFDWWRSEVITMGQVEAIRGKRVDVLLTHEAPASDGFLTQHYSKREPYWPARLVCESQGQRDLLREVFDEVQPQMVFHGHHHRHYIEELGDATMVGLDMNQSRLTTNMALVFQFGHVAVGRKQLDLNYC